jgi:DEAD/DEAH box helicase domain-containing protein
LQIRHPILDVSPTSLDEGELLVFAPRSEVGVRVRGELVSRTLLKPKLVPFDGGKLLMYQYESAPGVQAWIAHDQVEATGQNWKHAIWKPDLDIIEDLAA